MLIRKVLAPAANGLRAVQRDVKVRPAPTAAHSARETDGALLWNRFKVSFMLLIPTKKKSNERKEIKTMQGLLEITISVL